MSNLGRPVRGHTPVSDVPGVWRCKCGLHLSYSRRAARDVMRFHRIDLNMAARAALIAERAAGVAAMAEDLRAKLGGAA